MPLPPSHNSVPHIPEWTMKRRLPKHSLCMSHRKVDGKVICMAVPEAEADKHLAELVRFRRELEKAAARHAEATRLPAPQPTKAALARVGKVKPWAPTAKLHRHTKRCLEPEDPRSRYRPDGADTVFRPEDLGWFTCKHKGAHPYTGDTYALHQHRTKRGRRFLVAHIRGDSTCPDVRARLAAEAAEAAKKEATDAQ